VQQFRAMSPDAKKNSRQCKPSSNKPPPPKPILA
jgi:hypothetical protein